MKDEVLAESAPLHGRVTMEFRLQPFNYLDTAEFIPGYSSEEKAILDRAATKMNLPLSETDMTYQLQYT